MDSTALVALMALGYFVWRDQQAEQADATPAPPPPPPWWMAVPTTMPPTSFGPGNLGQPVTEEQKKLTEEQRANARLGQYVQACTTVGAVGGGIGVIGGPLGVGVGAGIGCGAGVMLQLGTDKGWF